MACRNKGPASSPTVTLTIDEQSAKTFAALALETLDADGTAVSLVDSGGGRWQVTIHCHDAPDRGALRALARVAGGAKAARALRFARVAARDWVAESLAGLKPVGAGRFVVHGGHDRAGVAVNRIGIEIEAALAFGTGHHGTTRGCLLALDRLSRVLSKQRRRYADRRRQARGTSAFPRACTAPWEASKGTGAGLCPSRRAGGAQPGRMQARILDLGTGSGVLAIAAARALHRRVLATDLDANSVRAARANARLNRAAPMVEAIHADGLASPAIRAGAPFDVVFANILLAPLQRLARPLMRCVAPGGYVVLSGLLTAQANAALAAYHRLRLERRIELDGWTTLVLRRPAAC